LVFEKKICDMLPRVLVLCFSVGLPTLRSFLFYKAEKLFSCKPMRASLEKSAVAGHSRE